MKKFTFILLSCVCIAHSCWGQDTLFSLNPPSGYYSGQWLVWDSTCNDYEACFTVTGNFPSAEESAYSFFAGDSLAISGIAVSMTTSNQFYGHPERYSLDRAYEYLKLYQYHADSMQQLGESFRIKADSTPVSYYFAPGHMRHSTAHPEGFQTGPVVPVYEFMFETPQVVTDTFFIGRTELSLTDLLYLIVEGDTFASLEMTVLVSVCDTRKHDEWPERLTASKDTHDNVVSWRFYPEHPTVSYISYYLFPIIAQDTTGGGEVSVSQSVTERYVTVQPNPAEKEARVLSSFGLERIEAYDGGGRQVLAREASGLAATIDVSSWPRGTYILRITTPMGTVTKKLLVQ